MKVVIDTNVLISAALRDRTPEEVILFIAGHREYSWIVSSEILLEYRSVLRRPRFALPDTLIAGWDTLLNTLTTQIEVGNLPDFPRDPKDAPFIACALVAGADFLVTGDKDFAEAQKLMNTTIISVGAFKRLIIDTAAG
ncbi:MAG TPA: putative toxin-antitoxin system toxin component, PIN family [Promineifilum sp.]|nr:putative toxin-antitoxin system toxin component, PIN family [Promineifilum sp.]